MSFPRNLTLQTASVTAASQEHHCAITSSGDLLCWGLNTYCQVPAGAMHSYPPSSCIRAQAANDGYCLSDRPIVTPTAVGGLSSRPVAVALGWVSCPSGVNIDCQCILIFFVRACDLVSSASMYCHRLSSNHLAPLTQFIFTLSQAHNCVLLASGGVMCWGYGLNFGQVSSVHTVTFAHGRPACNRSLSCITV